MTSLKYLSDFDENIFYQIKMIRNLKWTCLYVFKIKNFNNYIL